MKESDGDQGPAMLPKDSHRRGTAISKYPERKDKEHTHKELSRSQCPVIACLNKHADGLVVVKVVCL